MGLAAGLLVAAWGPALLLQLRSDGADPAAGAGSGTAPLAASERSFPAFAEAGGVDLHLVSDAALMVAFHEASRPGSRAMRPTGVCAVCRNRGKFRPPEPRRLDLPYIVMDSRGRRFPATSAVDVVVPEDAPLVSPVTGTVTTAKRYRLYERYPDVRVVIEPEARPELRVVMIHLRDVAIAPGDRVEASRTPIGRARLFSFRSHVDRYVGEGKHPHVHIEVKDGTATRSS